jgi:hypothetical protein
MPLAKRSAKSSAFAASCASCRWRQKAFSASLRSQPSADPHRAARLVGAAAAYRYGIQQDEVMTRLHTAFLGPARRRHGTDAWDAAVRDGTTMTLDDAIAYALDDAGT